MPTNPSPDTYITRRKDSPNYYFRCRFPADLLAHYLPRKEICRSLGTPYLIKARQKAKELLEALKRDFQRLRRQAPHEEQFTADDVASHRAFTSFQVRKTKANLAALLGVAPKTIQRWQDQEVLTRKFCDVLVQRTPEGKRREFLHQVAAPPSDSRAKEEAFLAMLAVWAEDLQDRHSAAQVRLLGLAEALREVSACLARRNLEAAAAGLTAAGIPTVLAADWQEALRNPDSTAGHNLSIQLIVLGQVVSVLASWGQAAAGRFVEAFYPCLTDGKLRTPAAQLRDKLCIAAGNGTRLSMNRTSKVLAKFRDSESVRQTLVMMGKGILPKEKQPIVDLIVACFSDQTVTVQFDADMLVALVFQIQDLVDRLTGKGWTSARIAKMKDWGKAWLGFLCPE